MEKKEEEITANVLPENISIENATYLHNVQNLGEEKILSEENLTGFEVESIQKISPTLFSEEENLNLFNKKSNQDQSEPELFENNDSHEEDLEIPAFLRKQKN